MTLRVLADAEAEIESARQYFNRYALALGHRFLEDLERTLERIEAAPESFPKLEILPASEPYRRALLNIFCYAVIFDIVGQEIVIIAVAHTSRQPDYWLSGPS